MMKLFSKKAKSSKEKPKKERNWREDFLKQAEKGVPMLHDARNIVKIDNFPTITVLSWDKQTMTLWGEGSGLEHVDTGDEILKNMKSGKVARLLVFEVERELHGGPMKDTLFAGEAITIIAKTIGYKE